MTGGINLTASMRSNLLSLQNISRQVSSTQNKLATGNKVNSAIDNPSSYYTARALNNRADDLNALLDSMGQAVSTIKAATTALEAGANFLEQAAAVANQALEQTADFKDYTIVKSKDELLAALADDKVSAILLTCSVSFNEDESLAVGEGKTLRGLNSNVSLKFDFTNKAAYSAAVSLADSAILQDVTVKLNNSTGEDQYAVMGGILKGEVNVFADGERACGIHFGTIEGTANVYARGAGVYGIVHSTLNGTANVSVTGDWALGIGENIINGTAKVVSNGTYANGLRISTVNGNVHLAVSGKDSTAIEKGEIGSAGELKIWSDGEGSKPLNLVKIAAGSEMWIAEKGAQALEQYIAGADYAEVSDITELTSDKSGKTEDAGSFKALLEETVNAGREDYENGFDTRDNGDQQYNQIMNQYDALVNDAFYKGINLLQQDKLSVKFNETGSALLNIRGKDMSGTALGLNVADWQTQGDIDQSLKEISAALKSIRSFSAELGNNYNIITGRQDFTENLINILTEGADKLTLADMNEESANMLALQTRQQLAINSLSLASQASQAVLKLF